MSAELIPGAVFWNEPQHCVLAVVVDEVFSPIILGSPRAGVTEGTSVHSPFHCFLTSVSMTFLPPPASPFSVKVAMTWFLFSLLGDF